MDMNDILIEITNNIHVNAITEEDSTTIKLIIEHLFLIPIIKYN